MLDVSSPHNRGRLSGQYQMWFFLGAGGAALFGGVMTDLLGFRQGLLIGGALTLLAALVWQLVLPDLNAAPAVQGDAADASSPGPFPWPSAIFAAVPMFVTRFVFAGVVTATAILWLTGLVGDGLPAAGLIVPIATLTGAFAALRALVGVLGARLAGSLSDLTGRRWTVAAGVMLSGAAGVALAASRSVPVALTGGLVAAVTAGGVQALAPAIAGDRVHASQRGRVLSVVYTLGDLGSALGPPLALWLVQWQPVAATGVAATGVAGIYRFCAALLGLTVVFALWRSLAERPARGAARTGLALGQRDFRGRDEHLRFGLQALPRQGVRVFGMEHEPAIPHDLTVPRIQQQRIGDQADVVRDVAAPRMGIENRAPDCRGPQGRGLLPQQRKRFAAVADVVDDQHPPAGDFSRRLDDPLRAAIPSRHR